MSMNPTMVSRRERSITARCTWNHIPPIRAGFSHAVKNMADTANTTHDMIIIIPWDTDKESVNGSQRNEITVSSDHPPLKQSNLLCG